MKRSRSYLRLNSLLAGSALLGSLGLAGVTATAPAYAQNAEFDSGLGVSNPLPVPDLDPGASAQKTLVIGIDGVRWDRVQASNTPNLKKILNEGTSSMSYTFAPAKGSGTVNLAPTVSGPSWSSILTGVWPDKHGVTSNSFAGKRFDQYPDLLTRAEQAKPELSTFAVAD
ncbi:alkaline phosphatase family protein [Acaricomes phytoseiuli]|uniref:alkaline phosphatase family protein n=1 Tax=Acaricomes phytoseiuli TaxID=291968 RepID=UPI000382CF40|nr:alkaline phosphatase family protein [Acaricomes phytoseiuli]MCW1248919.1 alkaline phosphatase family protein [Acaricomes phytoseiuli]